MKNDEPALHDVMSSCMARRKEGLNASVSDVVVHKVDQSDALVLAQCLCKCLALD